MASLRTLTSELSALGALAISMPLRFVLPRERFDPAAPHPTPVVFVHGFLGDPTNFLVLRSFLSGRGIRNFASFSYPPRLDYQRLAGRLEQTIEAVCLAAGAPEVDVVGHSLGGRIGGQLDGHSSLKSPAVAFAVAGEREHLPIGIPRPVNVQDP